VDVIAMMALGSTKRLLDLLLGLLFKSPTRDAPAALDVEDFSQLILGVKVGEDKTEFPYASRFALPRNEWVCCDIL